MDFTSRNISLFFVSATYSCVNDIMENILFMICGCLKKIVQKMKMFQIKITSEVLINTNSLIMTTKRFFLTQI